MLVRLKDNRQLLDLDRHMFGGVFSDVSIIGKDNRNGLADISDPICGQDRLAISCKPFDPHLTKIDRWDLSNVSERPDRMDSWDREGRRGVDADYLSMRMGRTNDAHMQLVRKIDVGGKPALALEQQSVFFARNGTADQLLSDDRHLVRLANVLFNSSSISTIVTAGAFRPRPRELP